VNAEYLTLFAEARIIERSAAAIRRIRCNNGRTLIIVPSLIGDFVTILPAIADFVARRAETTCDIVVTTTLKPLAECIRGIGAVYVARTTHARAGEQPCAGLSGDYEEVIVLRASADVLHHLVPCIRAARVVTRTREIARYIACDLLRHMLFRTRPTQLRDFGFELLGGTPRPIALADLLSIDPDGWDARHAATLICPRRTNVVIHTGASWPMMRWPIDRWIALVTELAATDRYNIIFAGLEKDRGDLAQICAVARCAVVSAIGLSVVGLVALMGMADSFIGIDSGPGNVAHLAGLKNVIIYGPGPHIYLSPDPRNVAIDKSNGRGIRQRYFTTQQGFIHRISVDEVLHAFAQLSPMNPPMYCAEPDQYAVAAHE
jgi:ADP-heptose:LPS heptosyltransferase